MTRLSSLNLWITMPNWLNDDDLVGLVKCGIIKYVE